MKIRINFVSNSSSSSFIVNFPEKVTTKEQLLKYLDKEWYDSLCDADFYHRKWDFDSVVNAIFSEVSFDNGNKENPEEICDDLLREIWELQDWFDERNIPLSTLKNKSLLEIVKEHCSSNSYHLTFSDEGGSFESDLEHNIAPRIFGKYLVHREVNH